MQIGKEEGKLSSFVDYMTLYIENPTDFTKTLFKLINKFSKVAGHINIQKFVAFLSTTSYQKENLRKQSHLQLHQKE